MTELPKAPDTFQDLIAKLQEYWAIKGCVIMQPLDMEVGAGTFHPATFLRAIGPEIWNSAYVQPSRRPTDGRYGENPNRLQHYYQFQVVMKPSPKDFQELYRTKRLCSQKLSRFVMVAPWEVPHFTLPCPFDVLIFGSFLEAPPFCLSQSSRKSVHELFPSAS